jgi:GH15 family glucan-1,4-alpha-glucosidase
MNGTSPASTMTYPPIGSLGAISDGHSLALLDLDGGVQWYCPLRFDADPVVWPLLDVRRGGALRVGPAGAADGTCSYVEGTAVLRYEWDTGTGRAAARVGMVFPNRGGQDLVWVVDGLAGEVEFEAALDPRPAFGRDDPDLHPVASGVQLTAGNGARLTFTGPADVRPSATGLRGTFTVAAGDQMAWCLHAEQGSSPGLAAAPQADLLVALEDTVAAWRDWQSVIVYDGPEREAVLRSAITLKLLIYDPSGAVVAAGTTSLPEVIGGVRNWDYLYTWLRDASFTLNALYQLQCTHEARRYARWMCDVTAAHGLPLRVLYGVGGESEFPEYVLDDLDGYRGSRPVRVGNGAEHQLQFDSYGELLDCLTICEVLGDDVMRAEWPHFRNLVEFCAQYWREPDSGIWEVRDRPRHFVHSKAMAWTALDRGCNLVEQLGLPGDVDRWRAEADQLRAEILAKGVVGGRFARTYGEPDLDASLLMLPLVGFVHGDDRLMQATIDGVEAEFTPEEAVTRGLLRRYRPEAGDGLAGEEGAFAICSFWLVEALALGGRHQEAETIFEGLVRLGGELGLFAEELHPASGEQLGNTPQAFTHIGLISAGLRLAEQTVKGTRSP